MHVVKKINFYGEKETRAEFENKQENAVAIKDHENADGSKAMNNLETKGLIGTYIESSFFVINNNGICIYVAIWGS